MLGASDYCGSDVRLSIDNRSQIMWGATQSSRLCAKWVETKGCGELLNAKLNEFFDWARRLKVLLRPCLYSTGENWTHGKRISHMRGFTERVIGFYFDIAKSTTTNRIQRARLFFARGNWRPFCITILRKHLTDLVSITVECRVLLYKQLMMAQQTSVCQPITLTGVVCMIIIRCVLLTFAYLTNRWKSRNRAWFFYYPTK